MRFSMRGKRGWMWPVIIAALVVIASGRSEIATPGLFDFDKVAHFSVFGLLATLVARNGFVPRYGWLAVLVVSLFGITDEWHQSFTPGRSVEFADWIADTLGATVAVTLYSVWPWYRKLLEGPLRRQRQVEKSAEMVPNPTVDPAVRRETHQK